MLEEHLGQVLSAMSLLLITGLFSNEQQGHVDAELPDPDKHCFIRLSGATFHTSVSAISMEAVTNKGNSTSLSLTSEPLWCISHHGVRWCRPEHQ